MTLEVIREKNILTEAQIQQLLDPVKLTGLDKSKYQQNNSMSTPVRHPRIRRTRKEPRNIEGNKS
jgi:hypothetical protein